MDGLDKERKQYQLDEKLEPSDSYTSEEKNEYVARFTAVQKDYADKDQAKNFREENLSDKKRTFKIRKTNQ